MLLSRGAGHVRRYFQTNRSSTVTPTAPRPPCRGMKARTAGQRPMCPSTAPARPVASVASRRYGRKRPRGGRSLQSQRVRKSTQTPASGRLQVRPAAFTCLSAGGAADWANSGDSGRFSADSPGSASHSSFGDCLLRNEEVGGSRGTAGSRNGGPGKAPGRERGPATPRTSHAAPPSTRAHGGGRTVPGSRASPPNRACRPRPARLPQRSPRP
jgi:hypothetical protein